MIYYTYLWLRENGTPYYVGKGKGNRAFVKRDHSQNPPHDKENILVQEFPDEASALEAEKFLISYYGRIDLGTGCLRNRTDGGDGAPSLSPEVRAKIANAHRKENLSSETLLKMRAAKIGRKLHPESIAKREETKRRGLTIETRVKLGNATRKMWAQHRDRLTILRRRESLTLETLAKMSASHKGSTHTPEVRSKLAEMARRCNLSPETLAKRSAALKGRTFSAETRAKMSAAAKARCARKQAGGKTMGELLDKFQELTAA